MTRYERGGKHIVNAAVDGNRAVADAKAAARRGKSTINSDDGQLITVKNPQPEPGCVPDKAPCGACAGCKHRAALKVSLTFDNPADRAGVLAKLGLVLLEEPPVRGPHTSPLLSEARRQALSASAELDQETIDAPGPEALPGGLNA